MELLVGPEPTVRSSRLRKEIELGMDGQRVVSSSAIDEVRVKKGLETRLMDELWHELSNDELVDRADVSDM
jgi:hypothetical protein